MSKIFWFLFGAAVLKVISLPALAQTTSTTAPGPIPLFQTQQSTYLGPTAPGATYTGPASAGIYLSPAGTIVPGTTAIGPTIYTGPTAAGNSATVVNASGTNTSTSTTATGTSTSTGSTSATGSAGTSTPATDDVSP